MKNQGWGQDSGVSFFFNGTFLLFGYISFIWICLGMGLPRWQCRRPEMWVRFLGRDGSLEEGMATHTSILAWRIPMERGAWWAQSPQGCKQSDTIEVTQHTCLGMACGILVTKPGIKPGPLAVEVRAHQDSGIPRTGYQGMPLDSGPGDYQEPELH